MFNSRIECRVAIAFLGPIDLLPTYLRYKEEGYKSCYGEKVPLDVMGISLIPVDYMKSQKKQWIMSYTILSVVIKLIEKLVDRKDYSLRNLTGFIKRIYRLGGHL